MDHAAANFSENFMTIRELIAAFLAWNSRHRKPPTQKFYSARLRLFLAKFSDRPAASLTSLEIDEYLHEAGQRGRGGQPASDTTRHHNAVALTTLQNWAVREKLIPAPWFGRLEKPRVGRRERVPTADEIRRLLKDASPRFRLIYSALACSGARPGELVKAHVSDVDWTKGAIVIKEHKTAGKTGKPRVIPIGKWLRAILRQAIGDNVAGHIFVDEAGKPWTVDGLGSIHRRLREAAGLDKALTLYGLRHRAATEMLRAGVGIKDVSQILGHATTATTEIYLHRDASELGDRLDKLPGLPDLDDPPAKAA